MIITFGLVISTRSNKWYESQGHEFDFQWDNYSGIDYCRLYNGSVVRWFKSQSKASGTIVEGEIVVGDINCSMAEARWAKSQSNRGTSATTLLSKKCYTLNFWLSGKHSIKKFSISFI